MPTKIFHTGHTADGSALGILLEPSSNSSKQNDSRKQTVLSKRESDRGGRDTIKEEPSQHEEENDKEVK